MKVLIVNFSVTERRARQPPRAGCRLVPAGTICGLSWWRGRRSSPPVCIWPHRWPSGTRHLTEMSSSFTVSAGANASLCRFMGRFEGIDVGQRRVVPIAPNRDARDTCLATLRAGCSNEESHAVFAASSGCALEYRFDASKSDHRTGIGAFRPDTPRLCSGAWPAARYDGGPGGSLHALSW